MRDSLRRRLRMLHATLHHFDAHPALWNGHPALVRNVQAVRERTAEIETAAEDQAAGNPTGLTKDKRDARDTAETLLGGLGKAAGAYAIESSDDDFRVAVDIRRSAWDAMADADFFARADVALDRLDGAIDDLADYGVTAAHVAEARAAVEAARPLGATRDARVAGRVSATAALDAGYSTVVPALQVLDRLVPRLVTDAAFVADYKVVRRIPGD